MDSVRDIFPWEWRRCRRSNKERRKFRSDKLIMIEEQFIFLNFFSFFSKVITIDKGNKIIYNKEILFR